MSGTLAADAADADVDAYDDELTDDENFELRVSGHVGHGFIGLDGGDGVAGWRR